LSGFSHERGESVRKVILAACAGVLDNLIDKVNEVESFGRRGVSQAGEPEACYAVRVSSEDVSKGKLVMSLAKRSYLWNMIHCDIVTILSCVSFKVDSFAWRASSENDMV
jgi:hypothetical protein